MAGVNGHRYQDGNTRAMVFTVAHLVSYISRYMTLMPGDVISTGTPPGVGWDQRPRSISSPATLWTWAFERWAGSDSEWLLMASIDAAAIEKKLKEPA
jgi:2-keto-4-pentenoate hydratase/2-oxohepta-3-ene-1,7-dioic acid hydratase in catechol pathway